MGKIDIKNYKPLGEIVFDHLKNEIIEGRLSSGERLMEVSIAEKLGVSRTPVREAIRKLEKEGFVVIQSRKGAYVSDTTPKDMRDVFEIRRVLEGFATELAAKNMTDEEIFNLMITHKAFMHALENNHIDSLIQLDREFHNQILKASGNLKLIELTTQISEQIQRYRSSYFLGVGSFDDLATCHTDIVNSIEKRDSIRAGDAARAHIKNIEDKILNLRRKNE